MPEATVQAWKDLWFHTGDRVVIEPDGWLRFVDRIKDVIRRRGENISSAEVEQVLLEHPAISEVAVYAVDSELGEDEVMAAIVPKGPVDFSEITEFCEPRLAKYAIPRFMLVRDTLPRTENGKVRKSVLRDEGKEAAQWDRELEKTREQTPVPSTPVLT
jgi:crotonobetaine/carnitine-CoA ligase